MQYECDLHGNCLIYNVQCHKKFSNAGFRSYTVRFPEEKLAIIIFANYSKINPRFLAMQVADIFIKDRQFENLTVKTHKLNKDSFTKFIGTYSDREGLFFDIIDSTDVFVKYNWGIQKMNPLSDYSFTAYEGKEFFEFSINSDTILNYTYRGHSSTLTKFSDWKPSQSELNKYVGTYKSESLETYYHIFKMGSELSLKHKRYEDVVLKPIRKLQFSSPHWWMANLNFKQNKDGRIESFEISNDRILRLKFQKLD